MAVPEQRADRACRGSRTRRRCRPVTQNAARRCASSSCAAAIAVDSSIVSCAATSRVRKRPFRCGAIARPYTPLRAASSAAPPNADAAEPPAPMTLTAENCDAPVNTSSDIDARLGDRGAGADATRPRTTMANTPTAKPSVTHAPTTCRMRSDRAACAITDDATPATRTDSGGRSSAAEAGWPCHGVSALAVNDVVPSQRSSR